MHILIWKQKPNVIYTVGLGDKQCDYCYADNKLRE